jgi:hypothetical protein
MVVCRTREEEAGVDKALQGSNAAEEFTRGTEGLK